MKATIVGEPKGTHWPSWQPAFDCAATKFTKNETFTPHEFHERCKIDYDTAKKYLPLMQGKDLGGGKKILSAPVAREGYVVDPPGEHSLGAARDECCRICDCYQTRKANKPNNALRTVVAVSVVGTLLASLLCLAWNRSTFTCENCGTKIDLSRWNTRAFKCPGCSGLYLATAAPAS